MGVGASLMQSVPVLGNLVSPEQLLSPVDTALKKQLADVALNTAKSQGATYADVRIGRYLNQSLATREKRVHSIAKAATAAVRIAKVNSKLLTEPVQLAPQKGFGEVSWKTPLQKNGFEIPIKEKLDLLLAVNAAAMEGGANF